MRPPSRRAPTRGSASPSDRRPALPPAILPDQFRVRPYRVARTSEEEHAGGGIDPGRPVDHEPVEEEQPEAGETREDSREDARALRADEAPQEMLVRPRRGHSRTALGAAPDLLEVAEEATQAEMTEAMEIERPLAYLLH